MLNSVLVLVSTLVALLVLLLPGLRKSASWGATLTPLASIIGSGFLVSAPLLGRIAGNDAILAISVLCGLGFLIGAVIRFNIAHVEPALETEKTSRLLNWNERTGRLVLVFAYFISVTYYLMLLSSFVLKALHLEDPLVARAITTCILAGIGGIGAWRGLRGIQRVETYAVSLNLAVIFGLLIGLGWFNAGHVMQGTWHLAQLPHKMDLQDLRVILGLLIVVQGFETTRFMGGEYAAQLRISAMRRAQIIASIVYVVFFALVTVLFGHQVHGGSVAAVIDMVGPVAAILPLMLTIGAIASQFSASIADSIGAAGLLHEATRQKLSEQMAYPVIAAVAIGLVWVTDVFGIINLASRAFALFYAVQCISALIILQNQKQLPRRLSRAILFGGLGLLCLGVVCFAIPSGA